MTPAAQPVSITRLTGLESRTSKIGEQDANCVIWASAAGIIVETAWGRKTRAFAVAHASTTDRLTLKSQRCPGPELRQIQVRAGECPEGCHYQNFRPPAISLNLPAGHQTVA